MVRQANRIAAAQVSVKVGTPTVPPAHRPSEPIPLVLAFLTTPWWMPIVLFWLVTIGIAYIAWRLK
jgi:hypothetical protein